MDSAGNNDVNDQLHLPTSETSENQRKADESDEGMERALQHKALLIGKYEAEEKAQREWEEKYRENNYAQVYMNFWSSTCILFICWLLDLCKDTDVEDRH